MKISKSKFQASAVILVFYVILFQDLVASFLFRSGIPFEVIRSVLLLKEVMVITLGGIFLFSHRATLLRVYLIAFTFYASIFVFVSGLPIYSVLLGFRTYLLFLFAFIVGEKMSSVSSFALLFLKHVKYMFIFLAVFSILEYFILPNSIWSSIFPVLQMKREVVGLDLPGYYDTGLPENAFGELTRRMLGPFNEPLYMAYFTIILLNFLIAKVLYEKKKPTILVGTGMVLVMLAQTRAVIGGIVLSILGLLFKGQKIKGKHILMGIGALLVVSIGIAVFWDWISVLLESFFSSGGRNVNHIAAYADGLRQLFNHPFGQGIGVSSNLVGFTSKNISTENAFIISDWKQVSLE